MVTIKKLLLTLIFAGFLAGFFSYKLIEIPSGLTVDEGAFGYNGVLLSRTGRDQNGRLMPVFVLSIQGKDWRQPVTQYFIAGFFKIFGPSVFNLRFTSVIVTIVSALLIFFLGRELLGTLGGILSAAFLLTTPLVMIQSHLALDNIMVMPFTLLWLLFILLAEKTKNLKYLFLAGVSLGIGFYSYKAMRVFVPVWCVLTIVYLAKNFLGNVAIPTMKQSFKNILFFSLGVLPFFAVIPILEIKYAGAVFDRQGPSWDGIYTFLYPYFSSFDPSFLFIKGDEIVVHSTGKHGMLLLASLPFFLIGGYMAIRKSGFWRFLLIGFLLAPLLFGFVGSVHRASRLMGLIPIYSLFCALGFLSLWQVKKTAWRARTAVFILLFLAIVNYADFVYYYWFKYPVEESQHFPDLKIEKSYRALAQEAKKRGLTPYIADDIYKRDEENAHFFEAMYFLKPPEKWPENAKDLPAGSIFMTNHQEIKDFRRAEIGIPYYNFQIKD
ncbi:MAG: glycosyltransferase family 39 protein [bacterium]|nr:glycosyltransferase family 39 protein [bacterium]